MMSKFLYSEKQSNVLASVGKITNIAYNDNAMAIQTMAFTAKEELLKHKACLMVIPDENHRKQLILTLTDLGMSSFVFECNPGTEVSSDDLDAIRNMLGQQHHHSTQPDEELAKFLFHQHKKEIIFYYSSLNQLVFKQKTWKVLLQDYLALKPNNNVLMLHKEIDINDFEFDAKEFDSLKQCLNDALNYYHPDFELADASLYKNNLNADLCIIDRLQDVTHELFTYREKASELRDEYYLCLNDLQNNHLLQNKLWAKNITKKLDLLAFRVQKLISNQEDKIIHKGIFSALKVKSNTINKVYIDIYADLEIILKDLKDKKIISDALCEVNIQNIVEVISKVQLNIRDWDEKTIERTTSYIKSANKLNIPDRRLLNLELSLSNLLTSINGSNIF